MTVEYTAHMALPIPDFDTSPWHEELEECIRAIDYAIYNGILAANASDWTNSTTYAIGDIVVDTATGILYVCAVANTSSVTPTTMAQERVAHPTFWVAAATIPAQRGTWTTATAYIVGDFVINANRYAVCLIAHTSGVFNTDLVAGKWSVLIDASSSIAGINVNTEDTIASAATCDLGTKVATRLFLTGTTGIASFGTATNTYKIIRWEGTVPVTHTSVSLICPNGISEVTNAGDIWLVASDSAGNWRVLMISAARPLNEGVIYGLTLANNAADATNDIDIASGIAFDIDYHAAMRIPTGTGITKRLDAAWAVGTGNGGLDVGAIANATYHLYLMKRTDTGVVDALFSLSPDFSSVFTITIAAPGVGTIANGSPGLVNGVGVKLATTGALPTGLVVGTLYYIVNANLAAGTFQLAATQGGAAINTTGVQSGVHTLTTWPTMPASYDRKRRIGSIIRTGAAIKAFIQNGDDFIWSTMASDVSGAAMSTAGALIATTVPTGIKVKGNYVGVLIYIAANVNQVLTSPGALNSAPSTTNYTSFVLSTYIASVVMIDIWTDIQGQIRHREDNASGQYSINTRGYTDYRGRHP